MNTLFVLIMGIVATVIVSVIVGRYYFRRTLNKQLTPYLNLSSRIFSGIDKTVREQLKFTFQETEVADLHHLEFLIANDGERAVSNCIEPLTLELPDGVQLLDASIMHRRPSALKVNISEVKLEGGKQGVAFNFPLLNKDDFFLVKLLLSGTVNWRELVFRILADDLPRTIEPKRLPTEATRKEKFKVEWAGVILGLLFMLICASLGYALYLLYPYQPGLFIYPWDTFKLSFWSVLLSIVWGLELFVFGIVGLLAFVAIGFERLFKRAPRFPLPDEFQEFRRFFEDLEAEKLPEEEVKS